MEKEIEVKPFKIEYYCDKCGEKVEFSGMVTLNNPPKYQYNCKCGERYLLDKIYPIIIYK